MGAMGTDSVLRRGYSAVAVKTLENDPRLKVFAICNLLDNPYDGQSLVRLERLPGLDPVYHA